MRVSRRNIRSAFAAACLSAALGVSAVACTSNPPQPSAGTQTPAPTVTASASVSVPSGSATTAPSESAAPAISTASPGASALPSGLAAELGAADTLAVCTALVGAPATSLDANQVLVGYNVGFANELASRLDLNPVIHQEDFSALISMIQTHSCDVSVASQNITADRRGQVNLIPYTQSKSGFPVLVQYLNPLKVKKLTDLCGLKASAAQGTTFVDQVNGTGDYTGTGLNAACDAAGKSDIDLHTFATDGDAVQALLDGVVDAYFGNANFADQYPGELQRSGADLPGLQQGIAVALDHPNLTSAIQSALTAMIGDGTYLQILGQYLPSDSVDNFSIIP